MSNAKDTRKLAEDFVRSHPDADENVVVAGLEADSPLHALLSLHFSAPDYAKRLIEDMVAEFVPTIIPKVLSKAMLGPGMSMEELADNSVVASFEGSVLSQQEDSVPSHLQIKGTVAKLGADIAEITDKAIKTHLLTATNDKYVNRDAYMDVISGHAILLRGVRDLVNVPDDYEGEKS